MNSALHIKGVTKRFGSFVANDNISLKLQQGEVLALLGENGAGKTTLMNIIFGHYVAEEGSVEVMGQTLQPGDPKAAIKAGIGMVHQHFTLAENLTVIENIMLGSESLWSLTTDKVAANNKVLKMSEDFGLQVSPDAKVSSLSVGEKQRVEILKALYGDAKVLILDEPTAVLTPQESERLFETLRLLVAKGLSIIFISHKLHEILAVSNRILVLRHGALVDEMQTCEADKDRLVSSMVGKDIAQPMAEKLPVGKEVFSLTNVCVKSAKASSRLERINLTARRSEILGITGVSGNGQSALANLLCGMLKPDSGEVHFNTDRISYFSPAGFIENQIGRVPEDRIREGVIGEMSLWENAMSEICRKISRFGFIDFKKAKQFTHDLIKDYDIRCDGIDQEARLLSGGNMQKLILARVLSQNPDLIIANQPIRGLDVGAIANVHDRLLEARRSGACVILITEDLDELLSISDRVAVMCHGELSPIYSAAQITKTELGSLMSGASIENNRSDPEEEICA
ncbi:sugar ABC transporter ATP-binding protein ['Osedax' symbiont bacterium Rs2_46_30_T18]|nr:sugar ABC transporter ATP-binding protein ['Osedax' symbiont bacterium Rs2_46_30_T18]